MAENGFLISRATFRDLEAVENIITAAKLALRERGVDQWQDGYPEQEILREDILQGVSYCAYKDGQLAATFVLTTAHEAAYDAIFDGAWLTSADIYGVVHRLAVLPCFYGQGLAKAALLYCENTMRQNGVGVLRVDTHADNNAMRSLLERRGFVACGKVLMRGDERIAYEKALPSCV